MKMKRSVGFIALVVCLAMMTFTGCDLVQQAQNKAVEFALNTAVDVMLDSAISANAAAGQEEGVAEVANHIKNKVTLRVTDSTISGEEVSAQCMITAPDMTDFIENFDASQYATEQELYDAIKAAADNAPMTQKEVTIGLKKTETGYEPLDVESVVAAFFGAEDMDMVNDLLSKIK
jgi:hypothetical protein